MSKNKCQKCGRCCTNLAITVKLQDDQREHWGAHLGREVETMQIYVDHRCAHLTQNNRCRIYPRRPEICRRFFCEDGGQMIHLICGPGQILS